MKVFIFIILFLSFVFLSSIICAVPAHAITYRTESSVDVAVGNPPVANGPSPTSNNCNGFYNFTNPNKFPYNANPKKNFGDQNCEYASNPAKFADTLLTLIDQQLDRGYKAKWKVIIEGESGYNPNAWAPPVGTQKLLNGSGAWGLIQMGSAEKNNNQYDRGDVYWQNQIQNGIDENNKILNVISGLCEPINQNCNPKTWCYWATARAFVCQKK